MSRPLSIGWLVWGDDPGGVASAVLNNGGQLRALGQNVSLWSLGPGPLADAASARGWPIEMLGKDATLHPRYVGDGFSLRGVLRRLAMQRALLPLLARALRERAAPDLLVIPWPDLMPFAGPVCRTLGIALVLEMPNTPSRYPLQLNQRAYAWAVRRWRVQMLANSDYSAAHMERVPGVAVVTPALDATRFDPAHVAAIDRVALGVPTEVPLLGLIARLEPEKGADLAIAALATLGDAAQGAHLLLVGGPLDSEFARGLRAQATAAGLSERVHFAGPVDEPEHFWAACDLALSPRKDAEPFGLSIIEAMLMARPVVAHALGQPAATLRDGETGWLYLAPTAEALAEALRRVLAARARWPAMGAAAREEARRRFTGPALAQRYLGLLRDHLARVRA